MLVHQRVKLITISGTSIGGTYHTYGLCKGISQQNLALYGTVPPFEDPEIPIDKMISPCPGHVPYVCRSHVAPQDLRTDRAPYYSSCPQQVESNAPASRPNATMRTDGSVGFVGGLKSHIFMEFLGFSPAKLQKHMRPGVRAWPIMISCPDRWPCFFFFNFHVVHCDLSLSHKPAANVEHPQDLQQESEPEREWGVDLHGGSRFQLPRVPLPLPHQRAGSHGDPDCFILVANSKATQSL